MFLLTLLVKLRKSVSGTCTALDVHSGPGERLAGKFDGIEPDGALRLRVAGGSVEVIRAGDVTFG